MVIEATQMCCSYIQDTKTTFTFKVFSICICIVFFLRQELKEWQSQSVCYGHELSREIILHLSETNLQTDRRTEHVMGKRNPERYTWYGYELEN